MVIDPHAVAYDRFAWLYDRHWGRDFTRWGLPVLDQLLLRDLPVGARLLDLCCGTGHLAQALTERGYRVTEVDASAAMLRFARQNAPASVRTFGRSPGPVGDVDPVMDDPYRTRPYNSKLLQELLHMFRDSDRPAGRPSGCERGGSEGRAAQFGMFAVYRRHTENPAEARGYLAVHVTVNKVRVDDAGPDALC